MGGQKLTVRKFDLSTTSAPFEIQPLRLPAGARILRVGEQGEDPLHGPRIFVWIEVDPTEECHELRYVVTFGQAHADQEHLVFQKHDWVLRQTLSALGGCMVMQVWISAPVQG